MPTKKKQLHFYVPWPIYEAFHSLFPGHGEKSLFLVSCVERAVAKFSPKEKAIDKLIEEIADEQIS